MDFSIQLIEKLEKEKHQKKELVRQTYLQKCRTEIKAYFLSLPVEEVYLTGSVLVAGKFNSCSDIDVAVKGLPDGMYFKSIFELEQLINRKIEIIELENCPFAEKIRKTGLKLICMIN